MSDPLDAPQIEVTLLCDDIRREVTGKEIIIGVYGEELITPGFPVLLGFTVFMRARFPKANTDFAFEFRVIGPSDAQLIPPIKYQLRSPPAERPQSATVSLGPVPLQIQSPSLVQFQWKNMSSDWATSARIEIKQGEVRETGRVVATPTSTS